MAPLFNEQKCGYISTYSINGSKFYFLIGFLFILNTQMIKPSFISANPFSLPPCKDSDINKRKGETTAYVC